MSPLWGFIMTRKITERQETVLSFIKDFIKKRGFPPTVRDIAAYLKITSLKAVQRHLEALEKKGYIRKTEGISRAIEVIGSHIPQVLEIPIAGAVRAGNPDLAVEDIEGTIALDSSLVRHEDVFFLRVKGDSMIEAHIKEGDLALVRPQPDAGNGEIIVALIGDEATLKIYYREKDCIRLQPANSQMEPIIIRNDEPQFRIVGKIVGLFRESNHITAFGKKS
jgi:repressor LexA